LFFPRLYTTVELHHYAKSFAVIFIIIIAIILGERGVEDEDTSQASPPWDMGGGELKLEQRRKYTNN
jgi:hypothetical protein